jgi:hypothetical protein
MADKILKENETAGSAADLIKNAVDPGLVPEANPDPLHPKSKFLSWTLYKDNIGNDYWQAVGDDGTVYTINENNPVVKITKAKTK